MSVPAVLLNHFFVTADRETFAAVEASGFVQRELGALEKRTTVRKDATYTGLYLYGASTYLEFLHPDSSFRAPAGIAFGVEGAGEIEKVCTALQPAEVVEIWRGDAPWFRSCARTAAPGALESWTMEYIPAFFEKFHPELPPARAGIARSDALTRYAASCGKLREREEGLFEDVIAIEAALPPADLEAWRQQMRAVALQGTELILAPARPGARPGIAAAALRLRRDAGRAEHRIGNTTLSLDGRRAVWRF